MPHTNADPALLLAWGLLLGAAAAALGLLILLAGLSQVFRRAPRLQDSPAVGADAAALRSAGSWACPPAGEASGIAVPTTCLPHPSCHDPGWAGTALSETDWPESGLPETSLTVVVPAYNEAHNIGPCLTSVLTNRSPCRHWQVLLVDDDSSDATVAIAREAASACGRPPERFAVLDAGARPAEERWVGKNWACSRAMEQVRSDWVLFLDADVRLQPHTLRRALEQAQSEAIDLLSLAPRLACDNLAEWMVQPIIASLLGLGFPIGAANDPDSPVAFAAGPFMLFRRSAYEAIGGHRALAAVVVEDLALARRIKAHGLRLRYLLGLDAVELHMYPDFRSLWEGWTKNWLLGLEGSVIKALAAAGVVLLLFSGPWLLAATTALATWLLPGARHLLVTALAVALVGISLQLVLRLWIRQQFQIPLTHWWLMGAGGLVVAAIGPTSVWRTLTGRGWTWKGRPLATTSATLLAKPQGSQHH